MPLKYLSNFWKTIGIPLINCEINLILTWLEQCAISKSHWQATFDRKIYVPVVTLSTQDNEKLLQQFKSGFKRIIEEAKKVILNFSLGTVRVL